MQSNDPHVDAEPVAEADAPASSVEEAAQTPTADATGDQPVESSGGAEGGPLADPERREQVKQKIIEAIRTVHDPEIPVNIYELGLIYDIDVQPSGDVNIRMTLTSPACPAAQELPVQVKSVTSRIAEVREADVKVVFDPPWKPSLMTEDARLLLGIF